MENKIRKAEVGTVLKIGQSNGYKTYTKDEFYCNCNGKKSFT